MNKINILSVVTLQCFLKWHASGNQVYVVTPSPKSLQIDEGRSAPFYYHNWLRRADIPMNTINVTTSSTTEKTKTPDLIFAEFESNSMRNIRKLLEKERQDSKITTTTTTTTMKSISVPDEEETQNVNYGLPISHEPHEEKKDMTDYFAFYNNLYNNPDNLPRPVYLPTTLPPTPKTTTVIRKTTTTTEAPINNVEDVWHIIDSQKTDQWVDILPKTESDESDNSNKEKSPDTNEDEIVNIDENFALPGFGKNGGENESRAIRTEPNLRFPYINLKPFKMNSVKQPQLIESKKGNNMLNLDNFYDIKNPVRGETQDVAPPLYQPIDRYNPAQPYLPHDYASKSKQSSSPSTPMKAVASLVPPPPPPPPKITDGDFPAPITYDSFPPYAPSDSDNSPPAFPPQLAPVSKPVSTIYSSPDDSITVINDPPMDTGYRYKPLSPPSQPFLPTLPPLKKPIVSYAYNKPSMTYNTPSPIEDKPENNGYQYDKPVDNGYQYDKPMLADSDFNGYHYDKPMSAVPDFSHYSKPEPPSKPMEYAHEDHHHDHHAPSYGHDSDFPKILYEKPHVHGGYDSFHIDNVKDNDDDIGMAPPPSSDTKNAPIDDDTGFPHDFPGDLHFHHDFDHDDHDVYHYHHPKPTTTTSTTEMPRVNRYSYYYIGKKLYYLPLYFSVYFIVYVGALIIKAILRHKIVYPNSYRPNDQTASFFSKRSVDSWDLSKENLHEITGKVTHYIAKAAEKYMDNKKQK